MHELSPSSPEKQKIVSDNARKFIIEEREKLHLSEEDATSYLLVTDWLETGEFDEEKVVSKRYADGRIELLHIVKVSVDGKRTAHKREITNDEYEKKLALSRIRVEKMRHELKLEQNGTVFDLKYDEFVGPHDLKMLEVDTFEEANRKVFDPTMIYDGAITEVSENRAYEGYRVADKL